MLPRRFRLRLHVLPCSYNPGTQIPVLLVGSLRPSPGTGAWIAAAQLSTTCPPQPESLPASSIHSQTMHGLRCAPVLSQAGPLCSGDSSHCPSRHSAGDQTRALYTPGKHPTTEPCDWPLVVSGQVTLYSPRWASAS